MPSIATPQEIQQVLDRVHCTSIEEAATLNGQGYYFSEEFAPVLALAERIAEVPYGKRVLFRVELHGVWVHEVWPLFNSLRKAHGFDYSIEEVSDEWISDNEREYLYGVVLCAMLSGWDFSLCVEDGSKALFGSHDGWIATDDSQLLDFLAKLNWTST